MRVIGGQFRSRIIDMPRAAKIRPTQDKVRQAVFNILADINGKKVLDLFAGSGAFGIEAISRGASYVTFVDNNADCIRTIRSNLESLAVDRSYYDIIRSNGPSALTSLSGSERFDIVFMDPPYHTDMAKNCLINIDSYDILARDSFVVVEHFKKDLLQADLRTLKLDRERKYGDTVVSIYRKPV